MIPMREPIDVLACTPHIGTLGSVLTSRAEAAPDREFLCLRGRASPTRRPSRRLSGRALCCVARGVRAGRPIGRDVAQPSVDGFPAPGIGAPGRDDGRSQSRTMAWTKRVTCSRMARFAAWCARPKHSPRCRPRSRKCTDAHGCMLNARGTPDCRGKPNFRCCRRVRDAPPHAPAIRQPCRLPRRRRPDTADAVCVFIYTSGTTGFPKGVMHSQRNLVLAGEGFVERMYLQPDDRLLCVLPMFHVNAICYSLGGALAAGATLILEPRFSASRFWQTVEETGATEVNTIAAVDEHPDAPAAQRVRARTPAAQDLRRALRRGDLPRLPATSSTCRR